MGRNCTWGFDNSGIWVDHGRRGDFDFGRNNSNNSSNNGAAIAAGILGALALGVVRDGMVYWNNGQRAWVAREGPGVILGDVVSGRHYNFNRS